MGIPGARNTAKHPTMHREVPTTKILQHKMSTVLKLENPALEKKKGKELT